MCLYLQLIPSKAVYISPPSLHEIEDAGQAVHPDKTEQGRREDHIC